MPFNTLIFIFSYPSYWLSRSGRSCGDLISEALDPNSAVQHGGGMGGNGYSPSVHTAPVNEDRCADNGDGTLSCHIPSNSFATVKYGDFSSYDSCDRFKTGPATFTWTLPSNAGQYKFEYGYASAYYGAVINWRQQIVSVSAAISSPSPPSPPLPLPPPSPSPPSPPLPSPPPSPSLPPSHPPPVLPAPSNPTIHVAKDPHFTFANGAKTDFRGKNNTLYTFLSSEYMNINVNTELCDFMLRKKLLVHGSFLTQVHVATNDSNISVWGSKIGDNNIILGNGTCINTPIKIGPKQIKKCGTTRIDTDYSSLVIQNDAWYISIHPNHVYNRISGPKRRFDISVKQLKPVLAHGLVGQSFTKNMSNGKLDIYPEKGEFTTSAMGEGSIEGIASDYETENLYTPSKSVFLWMNNSTSKLNFEVGNTFASSLS